MECRFTFIILGLQNFQMLIFNHVASVSSDVCTKWKGRYRFHFFPEPNAWIIYGLYQPKDAMCSVLWSKVIPDV